MRKFLLVPLVVGLTVLSLFVLGCGGDDDNGSATNGTAAQPDVPPATAMQQVTVKGGERDDNDYYFEAKNITVRPGNVRLTLDNVGPQRPHSIEVKNLSGDGSIAKVDRVEVGQSATLEFTVTQPGTYQLVCNIRGHIDRGMTGTLTVLAQ